jgi:hypothetical protein
VGTESVAIAGFILGAVAGFVFPHDHDNSRRHRIELELSNLEQDARLAQTDVHPALVLARDLLTIAKSDDERWDRVRVAWTVGALVLLLQLARS